MSRKIWKYEIGMHETWAEFAMPKGAKILHAAKQGMGFCLWAEVYPDRSKEFRLFKWVGTGHDIPEFAEYVASVVRNS
jgi:hypothetical protein